MVQNSKSYHSAGYTCICEVLLDTMAIKKEFVS
jgi:hypothetical protein